MTTTEIKEAEGNRKLLKWKGVRINAWTSYPALIK